MKKYKVSFSGFVYVEAESLDDAFEMARNDDVVYEEKDFLCAEEVDEFFITI